jgi:hypothetical protein
MYRQFHYCQNCNKPTTGRYVKKQAKYSLETSCLTLTNTVALLLLFYSNYAYYLNQKSISTESIVLRHQSSCQTFTNSLTVSFFTLSMRIPLSLLFKFFNFLMTCYPHLAIGVRSAFLFVFSSRMQTYLFSLFEMRVVELSFFLTTVDCELSDKLDVTDGDDDNASVLTAATDITGRRIGLGP